MVVFWQVLAIPGVRSLNFAVGALSTTVSSVPNRADLCQSGTNRKCLVGDCHNLMIGGLARRQLYVADLYHLPACITQGLVAGYNGGHEIASAE